MTIDRTGVHTSHCCPKCGCKYGDKDCPVVLGTHKAKYECESCQYFKEDLRRSLALMTSEELSEIAIYLDDLIMKSKGRELQNDSYPEHGHTWIVKFYSVVPLNMKTPGYSRNKMLHRQFGPFPSKEDAKTFARSYVKNYTVKGFIVEWRTEPLCSPQA